MKHLKRVVVRNLINGEATEASIEVRNLGVGNIVTVGEQQWLRFTTEVSPPQGMKRDDGTDVIDPVTITLVRQETKVGTHPVCAYFPTQQYHQYPWRFSAPFDVTTGRENLIQNNYNRWLLRETGRTMVEAAISKGVGLLSHPWELVPLQGNEDTLINLVWEGAKDKMKLTAWLPTQNGYVRPEEAVFPETLEVRKLVSRNDLSSIGEKRQWLLEIPSKKAREVLQSLGALNICCHILSKILAKGPRNKKSDWYIRTLDQIIALSEELGDDEVNKRLLNGKCVLNRNGQPTSLIKTGQSGRIVCNARSEILSRELGGLFRNSLLMILHKEYRLPDKKTKDEKDEIRHRVDEWLRSESSEDTFQYETRFDAATFIRTCIVGNNPFSNPEENADKLLNFVRNHLETYISDRGANRREETLAELGKSLFIKSHAIGEDGKDKIVFRLVSGVYIPAGFLDKPSWAAAAKGIPGFHWIDWRYRKSLVRPGNPMGVVAFLKALGASTGPRVEQIASDSYHNVYEFTRIVHGDPVKYPNFPHSSIRFGQYSDYGLVGDYKSLDLDRWFAYFTKLSHRERSKRAEALLRTFEDHWEYLKNKTVARAAGYYFNGKYDLGPVPSRWVWDVQNNDWVLPITGDFTKPNKLYANTEQSRTLLYTHREKVCDWAANNLEVARALGFQTTIPASIIVDNLREAQQSDRLPPIQRANEYYAYLSKCDFTSPELLILVLAAFKEGLLFAPGPIQNWWCPEECLREKHRDTFGDYCGYLHKYTNVDTLWDQLKIYPDPGLEFIGRLLKRVSEKDYQQGRELSTMLERTYLFTEKLLEEPIYPNADIPVYASGGWKKAYQVFTTGSDELAAFLESRGLYRWDFELADLVPKFQKWIGMHNIEREAEFKVLSPDYVSDPELEDKVHAGVQAFGVEVSRVNRDIWPIIKYRIREILAGKVKRMKSLQLEVKISLPDTEAVICDINVPAFYQNGNVYVSSLTKISDPSLAATLLSDLPLSGKDRWSFMKALVLQLSDPPPEIEETIDLFGDESKPYDYSELFENQEEEESSTEVKPPIPNNKKKKEKPVPLPHPVDEYDVEKDEGGEEPVTAEGGLTNRQRAKLRPPRRTRGSGGENGDKDRHSTKSTEQRAVDLFRMYVLEPENIRIKDQRLIRGVGADIIGDDNIFRELKARTGSAGDEIVLTDHEYARAEEAREAYELVIVEHVWDDPVITIIRNPLNRLTCYPVGNIVVKGWKELDPKPRIITLKKA